MSYIDQIDTRKDFISLLKGTHNYIFLKFTADWCMPCKGIEPLVNEYILELNEKTKNFTYIKLDVDDNLDIYTFMTSKKRIRGIPAILFYDKDNHTYIPDLTVNSGNEQEVMKFFESTIPIVIKDSF